MLRSAAGAVALERPNSFSTHMRPQSHTPRPSTLPIESSCGMISTGNTRIQSPIRFQVRY